MWTLLASIIFFSCLSSSMAQERIAPAYPLITHNPNFSIWSTTDDLTASTTQHWTGAAHGLLGLLKVDRDIYRFLGVEVPNYETVLPASDEDDYSMEYTENQPGEGWMNVAYDAQGWKTGTAPFSDNKDFAKTIWKTDDLWVRRTFELKKPNDIHSLFLKLNHDDDVEVYLNGKQVYAIVGWTNTYAYIPLDESSKKLLTKGKNVLAVHVKNTMGGQHIDFGLVDKRKDDSAQIKVAKQKSVKINATQTVYEFECGKVDLKLTFTSPLLMDDLDLMARPVSYITYEVTSNDGRQHTSSIYLSAGSSISVYKPEQEVRAEKSNSTKSNFLKVGTVEQPVLQKGADDMRIDWGHFYVAAPNTSKSTQFVSTETAAGNAFRKSDFSDKISTGKSLALNTVVSLGKVGQKSVSGYFALGYDEIYSIQYFQQNLRPWWNKAGNSKFEDILDRAIEDYDAVMQKSQQFDQQLYQNALNVGGEEYAHLCVLAYRQSIAAHTLVESPNKEILWLSKENNSGGFINTVDVTYPSSPLYLIYNPKLLEGMLTGIFYFSESGKYPHPWAAHDLGTYPLANGQTYGEPMPVEESGNMIIMTAAIAHAQGDASYAKKHWKVLSTWADYLVQEGFDPKTQLCTDDFAGHLARNANLSVKAIVGIACYARLAEMLGYQDVAKKYRAIADEMVPNWMKLADAGDHYALTFDDMNTWSQKYNLVWDKVLGLSLFPQEVYNKELDYYKTKHNRFGLPLDSRKAYTKNDWILWTATFARNDQEFKEIIHPVYTHALEGPTRVPLNDFYDSNTGVRENFKARSVVGGFYMKMFDKWLKNNRSF